MSVASVPAAGSSLPISSASPSPDKQVDELENEVSQGTKDPWEALMYKTLISRIRIQIAEMRANGQSEYIIHLAMPKILQDFRDARDRFLAGNERFEANKVDALARNRASGARIEESTFDVSPIPREYKKPDYVKIDATVGEWRAQTEQLQQGEQQFRCQRKIEEFENKLKTNKKAHVNYGLSTKDSDQEIDRQIEQHNQTMQQDCSYKDAAERLIDQTRKSWASYPERVSSDKRPACAQKVKQYGALLETTKNIVVSALPFSNEASREHLTAQQIKQLNYELTQKYCPGGDSLDAPIADSPKERRLG